MNFFDKLKEFIENNENIVIYLDTTNNANGGFWIKNEKKFQELFINMKTNKTFSSFTKLLYNNPVRYRIIYILRLVSIESLNSSK
jgi:hypothetical protein